MFLCVEQAVANFLQLEPAVVERLLATAPWLAAMVHGERPRHWETHRRNIAQRALAESVCVTAATDAELRAVQKSPRLGQPRPRPPEAAESTVPKAVVSPRICHPLWPRICHPLWPLVPRVNPPP